MDLIKAFEFCNSLWEASDSSVAEITNDNINLDWLDYAFEDHLIKVQIRGKQYDFVTPFIPVEELTEEGFDKPGIYIWEYRPMNSRANAMYYIGQATNIYNRTVEHKKAKKNDSLKLHNTIRAHGLDNFSIAVIELYSSELTNNEPVKEWLNRKERDWINILGTYVNQDDFNLTAGGEGGGGFRKMTPEIFARAVELLRQTPPLYLNDIALQISKEFNISIDSSTIGDINELKRFSYALLAANLNTSLEDKIGAPIRPQVHYNPTPITNMWKIQRIKRSKEGNIQDILPGEYLGYKEAWREICKYEELSPDTPVPPNFSKAYKVHFGNQISNNQYERTYKLIKHSKTENFSENIV